jgi:hypothetical protein
MVVKLRMSEKSTVTSRRSPPSRSRSGSRTISSVTSSLRYCPNAVRMVRFSRSFRDRAEHGAAERAEDDRPERIDGAQHDAAAREHTLREPRVGRHEDDGQHRAAAGAPPLQDDAEEQAEGQHEERLGRDEPPRAPEAPVAEDVLHHGRLQLDARGDRRERRGDLVVARGGEPDQGDPAGDGLRLDASGDHVGRGDVPNRLRRPEVVHVELTRRVDGEGVGARRARPARRRARSS